MIDTEIATPSVCAHTLLHIYTDGSCVGPKNSRKAGYGLVIVFDEDKSIGDGLTKGKTETYGGVIEKGKQTNNIAELTAIYEALKILKEKIDDGLDYSEYVIHSDSVYAMKCVTIWYFKWKQNGWKTTNGSEVQNKDLIKSILEIQDTIKGEGKRKIRYKYVKAHDGDTYNEMADKIAYKYAKGEEENGKEEEDI